MTNTNIITTNNLCKNYGVGDNAVRALKNCNIEIHTGESVAVTGASGSGKSTFLTLVGGITTVKSNMVYTLCKHMVYMLSITNEHKNELEMRAKPEWKVHFLCFASAKRGSFSIR